MDFSYFPQCFRCLHTMHDKCYLYYDMHYKIVTCTIIFCSLRFYFFFSQRKVRSILLKLSDFLEFLNHHDVVGRECFLYAFKNFSRRPLWALPRDAYKVHRPISLPPGKFPGHRRSALVIKI